MTSRSPEHLVSLCLAWHGHSQAARVLRIRRNTAACTYMRTGQQPASCWLETPDPWCEECHQREAWHKAYREQKRLQAGRLRAIRVWCARDEAMPMTRPDAGDLYLAALLRPRTPGPGPWHVCSRPTCRRAWRSLAFTDTPDVCLWCGQPWLPRSGGPRLTRAQREAMR